MKNYKLKKSSKFYLPNVAFETIFYFNFAFIKMFIFLSHFVVVYFELTSDISQFMYGKTSFTMSSYCLIYRKSNTEVVPYSISVNLNITVEMGKQI